MGPGEEGRGVAGRGGGAGRGRCGGVASLSICLGYLIFPSGQIQARVYGRKKLPRKASQT